MNLFEKRPLALILSLMLGVFLLFSRLDIIFSISAFAVFLCLFICSYLFQLDFINNKKLLRLIILIIAIALLLCVVWHLLFFPFEYNGEISDIYAKVYEKTTQGSNVNFVLSVESVNGKWDNHKLLFTTVDYSVDASMRVGDYVCIRGEISSFGEEIYDHTYHISKGLSGEIINSVRRSTISRGHFILPAFLDSLRLKVSDMLISATDKDTGGFISAIMTGERSLLGPATALNFKRIGITHILALSGMHLVILTYAISRFLSVFGFGKKTKLAVGAVFCLLYMLFTGAAMSVVRAAIMMLISSLLFLSGRTRDTVTSLVVAVATVAIASPYSVFDLSLWLSAFATLGVIAYARLNEGRTVAKSLAKRLLNAFIDGILASVFAIGASFIIMMTSFEYFSLISPISTLLFSIPIEAVMYLSLILILSWGSIPIGGILVHLVDLIQFLADWLSSSRYVVGYFDTFDIRLTIIVFSIFFFAFLFLKSKKRVVGLVISLSLFAAVFIEAAVFTAVKMSDEDFVYHSSQSGDSLLLKTKDEVTLIYSGYGTFSSSNECLNLLKDQYVTCVDRLLILSYSKTVVEYVNNISLDIRIDEVMIPAPESDREFKVAENLAYTLSEYPARLDVYKKDTPIEICGYLFTLLERHTYNGGTKVANAFILTKGEKIITYISRGLQRGMTAEMVELINISHVLIIGSNGYISNSAKRIDCCSTDAETVIHGSNTEMNDVARRYYDKKGVSVIKTEAPLSVYEIIN